MDIAQSRVFKWLKKISQIYKKITLGKILKFCYYLVNEDREAFKVRVKNFLGISKLSKHKVKLYRAPRKYMLLDLKRESNPLVSIIIPITNWRDTYCCIWSVIDHTLDIPYEIILIDGKDGGKSKKIKQYLTDVTIIKNNIEIKRELMKAAKGKYFVFLKDDTNVQQDWLTPMVNLIVNDHSIGLIGSKILSPEGEVLTAGGILWRDASFSNYGENDFPEKPEYNYVKDIDFTSPVSTMIRASLWEEIGSFEDIIKNSFYRNAELAFKARECGYKVKYQPMSVIVNKFSDIIPGINELERQKFAEKWKQVLETNHISVTDNLFKARDRSINRKTILCIDTFVPTYDKDAGSRTMYQYLKLFYNMGMNVKFLGDNPYPFQPYTDELLQLGIEVLYGDYYYEVFEKWIIENGKFIDYTYLTRPDISRKYIDLIKENTDSKIIYNGCDFHWIREERQYRIDNDPETLKRSIAYKEIEFDLFRKSDVVITISEYEKAILEKEMPNKKVFVIPTFIYDEKFPLGINNDDKEKRYITFVGGFLHKPNIDGIIWFKDSIWPKIQKIYPELELKIIGSNPSPEIKKLADQNTEVTGFLSDKQLEEYYSKTRVIVAPLRFGAGVKGKVIEAIAHGIPVVTTSIGAEGIKNAENIMFIKDEEEAFSQSVIDLVRNDALWIETRQACISYSENHFSTKVAEGILKINIFNQRV